MYRRLLGTSLVTMALLFVAPDSHSSIYQDATRSLDTRGVISGHLESRLPSQHVAAQDQRTRLCADFEVWIADYLATSGSDPVKGIELAVARRAALKDLILSDPARALSFAISRDIRKKLPQGIGQYLEEQISAYGDYFVVVADEIGSGSGAFVRSSTDRSVVIQGKLYKAEVYGW